jgi:hypothetical protein
MWIVAGGPAGSFAWALACAVALVLTWDAAAPVERVALAVGLFAGGYTGAESVAGAFSARARERSPSADGARLRQAHRAAYLLRCIESELGRALTTAELVEAKTTGELRESVPREAPELRSLGASAEAAAA